MLIITFHHRIISLFTYLLKILQAGWCLSCLLSNIKSFPPTALAIPILLQHSDLVISKNEKLDNNGKEMTVNLKQAFTQIFEQKIQASLSEPRYDLEIPSYALKSPYIKKREFEEVNETREERDEDISSRRPSTARYHRDGYQHVSSPQAVIAEIEDVWLQVEQVGVSANTASVSTVQKVLTSSTKGHLIFYMNQVSWTPSLQENTQKDPALAIQYERISQYTASTMHTDEGEVFYLSLYTQEVNSAVYYLFPLMEREIHELEAMLQDITGKEALDEQTYTHHIMEQKLTAQRVHILRMLLQEKAQKIWIDDMDTLTNVIKGLTSVTKQRTDDSFLYELERLFHSCRLNDEVAVETITILKSMWENTPEAIHLKILTIVDRLLDRSLMHTDSPAFRVLIQWLDHVEKTLNPYKNSRTLDLIYELKARVQVVKKRTLVPVSSLYEAEMNKQKITSRLFTVNTNNANSVVIISANNNKSNEIHTK